MDFEVPSTGELAWSAANDIGRKVEKLLARIQLLENRVSSLEKTIADTLYRNINGYR